MKILFVEDNDDVREVFAFKVIDLTGAEVIHAASGKAGIEILKQLQAEIDMIICDHHMLDGNGDEVYKFLEGNPLQEKFIVMTGDSDLEVKKLYPGLDKTLFLTKPPIPDSFEEGD
jgi:CheY-like chemotaxis protein